MRSLRSIAIVAAITISIAFPAAGRTLPIQPVSQNLSNWCWLAAGEMIFRYYGVPNVNPAGYYQCGIAAAVLGGACVNDCRWCNVGSGTAHTVRDMLELYPRVVSGLLRRRVPQVSADFDTRELTEDEVKEEIDANRPIVAGISPHSGLLPPDVSEHAVLIVGYEERNGDLTILINDPFPYQSVGLQDPYTASGGRLVRPGRYAIPYQTLVDDLAWGNTIFGIERN